MIAPDKNIEGMEIIIDATNAVDTTDATNAVDATDATNAADTTDVAGAQGVPTTTGMIRECGIMGDDVTSNSTDLNVIVPVDEEQPSTSGNEIVEPMHTLKATTTTPVALLCCPTTAHGSVSSASINTTSEAVVGAPGRGGIALVAEGWARDAQVVEGIFRIMEGMEPPWMTIEVLEVATMRFPTVDRELLQRIIMTVMMTQRRCVVRLTRAGLRRGPRTDRDGNSFVELDLDFADRYSMSH